MQGLEDPTVERMTLRNVACNSAKEGGSNVTIKFDKKNPAIEDYTHCKTQLKTAEVKECSMIEGQPIDDMHVCGKNDPHILGAQIVFVDRGAVGATKPVENFTLDKKTGFWTCVWTKPKHITFPHKVEINIKYKDHSRNPKVYDEIKFETKLTDPEHPPAGCCAIQ